MQGRQASSCCSRRIGRTGTSIRRVPSPPFRSSPKRRSATFWDSMQRACSIWRSSECAHGPRTCWRRGREQPEVSEATPSPLAGAAIERGFASAAQAFAEAAERALVDPKGVSSGELELVLTGAIKLYAAKAETEE